jgi:predicted transcriptional regulator
MSARPSTVPDRLTPAQDRILHKIANGLDTEATVLAISITRGTVSVPVSSMSPQTVITVRRTWNVEQVVGYLYSTLLAAPLLFMERRDNYESAVKTVLAEYAAGDVLTEDNAFAVLTAQRPSSREGR